MRTKLKRTTLTTSRLMDFFSEKELVTQTGHAKENWPLVVLKELIDNALDACEEAGISPKISVIVNDDGIQITDNGLGIPADTITEMLNFSVRVSSREAYVAPDRGAQGNALKTIVAIPYVLHGSRGQVEIEAKGVRYIIGITVDAISQNPIVEQKTESSVKKGTSIKIFWPDSARSMLADAKADFLPFAVNTSFLNPHLTLNLDWFSECQRIEATTGRWPKWCSSSPTSAHWYKVNHLSRLIAAYIGHDRNQNCDRTVRDFVGEFRGLTSTTKRRAVLDETGFGKMSLSALANHQGVIPESVESLITSMRKHSDPVKPAALGVIGRKHIEDRFKGLGCAMESFKYQKIAQTDSSGLPYVLEVAFAWCEGLRSRRLITGVNWSAGIVNPFREIEYESLDAILEQQRTGADEPVAIFVHLACPRAEYTDRGKSAILLDDSIADAIKKAVIGVTKTWTKQRKKEERKANANYNRRQAMKRTAKITIKDIAWDIMEAAYLKASDNGRLPANARQIMYAARPEILKRIGNDSLDDKYFTQKLLPDYIKEFSEQTDSWDVAYDARGHCTEPHTDKEIGLGTLGVRDYLQKISNHTIEDIAPKIDGVLYPTMGPENQYGAILFIEKEGFMPLFKTMQLAERYDLAIMSTKGVSVSVTAARQLVDRLCFNRVPLFVLHDFDKAGFSILGTLHNDTRRYAFENLIDVIDLGIRLNDVHKYRLDSEICNVKDVEFAKLMEHGATQSEIDFLSEHRVELNAFSSKDFIEWIESKLKEYGVKKVIPDNETLLDAFRRAALANVLNKHISLVIDEAKENIAELNPLQLTQKVSDLIKKNPHMPWDWAINKIAEADIEGGDFDDGE